MTVLTHGLGCTCRWCLHGAISSIAALVQHNPDMAGAALAQLGRALGADLLAETAAEARALLAQPVAEPEPTAPDPGLARLVAALDARPSAAGAVAMMADVPLDRLRAAAAGRVRLGAAERGRLLDALGRVQAVMVPDGEGRAAPAPRAVQEARSGQESDAAAVGQGRAPGQHQAKPGPAERARIERRKVVESRRARLAAALAERPDLEAQLARVLRMDAAAVRAVADGRAELPARRWRAVFATIAGRSAR